MEIYDVFEMLSNFRVKLKTILHQFCMKSRETKFGYFINCSLETINGICQLTWDFERDEILDMLAFKAIDAVSETRK